MISCWLYIYYHYSIWPYCHITIDWTCCHIVILSYYLCYHIIIMVLYIYIQYIYIYHHIPIIVSMISPIYGFGHRGNIIWSLASPAAFGPPEVSSMTRLWFLGVPHDFGNLHMTTWIVDGKFLSFWDAITYYTYSRTHPTNPRLRAPVVWPVSRWRPKKGMWLHWSLALLHAHAIDPIAMCWPKNLEDYFRKTCCDNVNMQCFNGIYTYESCWFAVFLVFPFVSMCQEKWLISCWRGRFQHISQISFLTIDLP